VKPALPNGDVKKTALPKHKEVCLLYSDFDWFKSSLD